MQIIPVTDIRRCLWSVWKFQDPGVFEGQDLSQMTPGKSPATVLGFAVYPESIPGKLGMWRDTPWMGRQFITRLPHSHLGKSWECLIHPTGMSENSTETHTDTGANILIWQKLAKLWNKVNNTQAQKYWKNVEIYPIYVVNYGKLIS